MKLVLGTRGSQLSLIQARGLVSRLSSIDPAIKLSTKIIKTAGDLHVDVPLQSFPAKGIFEREIDIALQEDTINLAIHSAKDLPSQLPDGLEIAAVPERITPNDVLVAESQKRFFELSSGSTIGTSSPLRSAEILHLRPDLKVRQIRGNVENRVAKVLKGDYDAVILAESGLVRLEITNHISERLSLREFPPAAGQGTIAVIARNDDEEILGLLKNIDDPSKHAELTAERTALARLEGGCSVPIGAIAIVKGSMMSLEASIFTYDGLQKIAVVKEGKREQATALGEETAKQLMTVGGRQVAASWRS